MNTQWTFHSQRKTMCQVLCSTDRIRARQSPRHYEVDERGECIYSQLCISASSRWYGRRHPLLMLLTLRHALCVRICQQVMVSGLPYQPKMEKRACLCLLPCLAWLSAMQACRAQASSNGARRPHALFSLQRRDLFAAMQGLPQVSAQAPGRNGHSWPLRQMAGFQ